ncbi:MAG: TetR family transcriptional regulator [Acidimicrobiales bacterium]|nr:TetR family transcriptional regulator [Acidimicrobiales bacterium]
MPRAADPTVAASLVEAAARLLATEGPAALSTRRLAREIGASTMAVYTHFGGMDDLVRAVVRAAFDHLAAELDRVPVTDDPLTDLAQLGLAYRRNALADPHLYLAMFGPHPDLPYQPTEADRVHGLRTFTTLVQAVQRCLDADPLAPAAGTPDAAGRIAAQVWAAAHGAMTLELAGFLDDDGATFTATTLAVLVGVGLLPDNPSQ